MTWDVKERRNTQQQQQQQQQQGDFSKHITKIHQNFDIDSAE